MPLLSAEDFRLSSERKLAVHNCPLLRSVLISTLLSNLDSDTRPFTAILAASCTTPATSCAVAPCSPDRENMSICDAFLPGSITTAAFEEDGFFCSSAVLTTPMERCCDSAAPNQASVDEEDTTRVMAVTEAELDFACSDSSDALLLSDDTVLDSSSSCSDSDSDDSVSALMGCDPHNPAAELSGCDPEAIPVDIISVASPSALSRTADPLLFVQSSADRDATPVCLASPASCAEPLSPLASMTASYDEESVSFFSSDLPATPSMCPSSTGVCGSSSSSSNFGSHTCKGDAANEEQESSQSKNKKKRTACDSTPSSSSGALGKRLKKLHPCTPLSERLM